MSEDERASRVIANAAAVGVRITPQIAQRVSGTIAALEAQLADTPLDLSFETEPSTFVVVQRGELG